jgi:sugar phosphate isomerase/epimerase
MKKSIITDQISMDLETALKLAKENGFDCVELHGVWDKTIEDCNDEEVTEIKRLLTKYEMSVSNLATTIFFMCKLKPNYILKSFSPTFKTCQGDSVEEHLDTLKRACEIAKRLDCPNIRIFPFRYPENHILVGTDDDLELITRYFAKALEIVKHYKVTLVIENCPYSHCPKPEMTMRVIRTLDHPRLRLLYDPANSYRAVKERVPAKYLRLSMREEIDLIKGQVNHIHLKNYAYDPQFEKPFVHVDLTQGDLNYSEILSQLKLNGYDQALSLEPEVPVENVVENMKALNALIQEIWV